MNIRKINFIIQVPIKFFKAYDYKDGELQFKFAIDFATEKLGMPHQMRFGAYSLYAKSPKDGAKVAELSK